VLGDAHELPFLSGIFDAVNARNVIEHLSAPNTALMEMYRVMKK
jgi:ubiquinone/menaquinone biosynthesis C-methylase UbiE